MDIELPPEEQSKAGAVPGGRVLRRFWRLAGPFFTGAAGRKPQLLVAGAIILTMAQTGIQIRFNIWNRDFFNALEAHDGDRFMWQMVWFAGLAILSMVCAVYQLYLKQMIQLRWRAWLTDRLIGDWLRDGLHYQLGFAGADADNPDQRIAEDARVSTEMAVDFVLGLAISLLMLCSFVGILWTLSGSLFLTLSGKQLEIPGYMVWCALGYALVGSFLTWRLGRPLVGINIRRNGAEADFRFGLVRLRESSEGVALIQGEADERNSLNRAFDRVARVWVDLMGAQRKLMWLTSAYGSFAMVFPTLVASPRYFAGAITLGGLMQIGSAFGQVQGALNWFVDNFSRIAEWRSAVERVLNFHAAIGIIANLKDDPEQSRIERRTGDGSELVFEHLSIASSAGVAMIGEATARIQRGERVLITGESGSGKSTLFRAVAGLWPWGDGTIVVPPREECMFMPQRPYLPLGTLRAALAYPRPADSFDDEAMRHALKRCELAQLVDRLDEEQRWDQSLSLGEQQRVAFARLMLQRPAWVFMDEATAALDEAAQESMMGLFHEELEGSALVSIGHRPGLDSFHDRTLTLQRNEGGARLVVRRPVREPPLSANVTEWLRQLFRPVS